jgi:phenylalanyl-tRNA synthetase beta subunit
MLSVCSFDPTTIRKTSQKLGLRTDASKRFENDVPPALSRRALDRFAELITEVADGKVSEDVCDVYPQPDKLYKVGITPERVNRLLGTDISTDEMVSILSRLGCDVEMVTPREFINQKVGDLVGAPYEYGASVLRDAPEKFDCSSFTSWLYVQGGIALPRITADQFVYTEEITEEELQSGDLIFSNTQKQEGGEIYNESQEYMPGTEISGGVDHCGVYLGDGKVVHASRHNLDEQGGVEVEDLADAEQFQNITKFGRVPEGGKEHIVATIPAFRTDLRIGADLIEEIARVYGYDNIAPTLPSVDEPGPKQRSNVGVISDVLVSLGLSEVKTYSLINMGEIKVANPVAEDKAYLRTTIRDNLKELLEMNQPHLPVLAANEIAIFEVGQVFNADEELTEVAVATRRKGANEAVADIFGRLAEALGISIDPEIKDSIGTATFADVESLALAVVDLPAYREIPDNSFCLPSAYPYVLRDIAVWTPAGTEPEEVKSIIQNAAGDLLVATKLFDTYEKDDQISYAFKLVFQSDERTLSDKEVNEHMQAIEEALEENGGFSVR